MKIEETLQGLVEEFMVKEKLFQQTDEAESVEETVQELDEDLTEKGKKIRKTDAEDTKKSHLIFRCGEINCYWWSVSGISGLCLRSDRNTNRKTVNLEADARYLVSAYYPELYAGSAPHVHFSPRSCSHNPERA